MAKRLSSFKFDPNDAEEPFWYGTAGLERVRGALADLDDVRPAAMRAELRDLLTEMLGLVDECRASYDNWYADLQRSEEQRERVGRPPLHKWTADDFYTLERHAEAIDATRFWSDAANLERLLADRPAWIDGLTAAKILNDLPDEYRESATALLPKLRDPELTYRDRQPWPLALWHAQLYVAGITLANRYRPATLATMLRRLR